MLRTGSSGTTGVGQTPSRVGVAAAVRDNVAVAATAAARPGLTPGGSRPPAKNDAAGMGMGGVKPEQVLLISGTFRFLNRFSF